MKTIYLAGGCFWGVQKFFDQFDGVVSTEAGYANGDTDNPRYEQLYRTGHAETVKVDYDESRITLTELLDFYFSVIDPTSLNRQGADTGTQYRTGIYYVDEEQRPVIRAALKKASKEYNQPIVVEFQPLKDFWRAEEYHQKYLDRNPGGYCHISGNAFRMEHKRKKRSMRIYLLRHGRTDLNKERRLQGRMNIPLNETGQQQALEMRDIVREKGIVFDKIYSSPLERAVRTCELVTGVDRSDFTIDDRLAEMSFGPIEGQRYSDLTDDQKYFFTDPGKYKPLGNGETYQELTERIMGLMNELKDTEPGKNVLLASHGTAIHAVLAAIRDKDIEYFWDENVGNCDITFIDVVDGEFLIRDEKLTVPSGLIPRGVSFNK